MACQNTGPYTANCKCEGCEWDNEQRRARSVAIVARKAAEREAAEKAAAEAQTTSSTPA